MTYHEVVSIPVIVLDISHNRDIPRRITLTVDKDTTSFLAKQLIADRINVHPSQLSLVYIGKGVDDSFKLIKAFDGTVHIIVNK